MPIIRKSPEEILEQIHIEEHESKRGKLKIFFGYAAGVGKTYAMLEAAHEAKKQGIDVVAGYIEPHARPATAALVKGLEVIPPLVINHKDIALNEFNLDAAIKRNPQLILVDELAHTNADGCRHIKRYQDIEELLKAGIDVYTTINVQHIESLNDIVASITKIIVRERIPDRIFDEAEQVELVDIEPSDLVTRLSEGKIYQKEQADRALGNFFTVENLTALREIALRRMADRVNKISLKVKNENNKDYYTNEHILVCLSSSPSNSKIIRTAARMANAFKAQFTALFVQTSSFEKTSLENKKRLKENIHLAEQLGAKIEMVVGEDIPFQIAEFARLAGVSKLVIGRSTARNGFMRLMRKSFTDKLIEQLPNLDIHVIPDNKALFYKNFWKKSVNEREICNTSDIITILVILIITSMIGMLFYSMNLGEANIMTVYILGVLIAALKTSKRLYSVVLSVLNVLAFDFLFIEPRYTFTAYDPVYIITFSVMFVSAFVTGGLTNKIKNLEDLKNELIYIVKQKYILKNNEKYIKQISLTSVIKDWCETLNPKIYEQLFKNGTERCLKLFKEVTNDETECISKLAKIATDLRIEDWDYQTITRFKEQLEIYKKTAEEYTFKDECNLEKNSRDVNSYQLTFIDNDGNNIIKRFEKVEYGSLGKLLYNSIWGEIDSMGQSISEQEKRQVLIEVLKELC